MALQYSVGSIFFVLERRLNGPQLPSPPSKIDVLFVSSTCGIRRCRADACALFKMTASLDVSSAFPVRGITLRSVNLDLYSWWRLVRTGSPSSPVVQRPRGFWGFCQPSTPLNTTHNLCRFENVNKLGIIISLLVQRSFEHDRTRNIVANVSGVQKLLLTIIIFLGRFVSDRCWSFWGYWSWCIRHEGTVWGGILWHLHQLILTWKYKWVERHLWTNISNEPEEVCRQLTLWYSMTEQKWTRRLALSMPLKQR